MNHVQSIALLFACALAGCGSAESRLQEVRDEVAGANVLLIAADSFAAGHSSTYGYERITTPNLSKLAEEGIRFADASAGSPSGFASTATLFSGEALDFAPVDEPGKRLVNAVTNLAEAFQAEGYLTVAVSTHPAFRMKLGHNRGFDMFSDLSESLGEGVSEAANLLVEKTLASKGASAWFTFIHLGTALPPRVPEASRAKALLGYAPETSFGTREFMDEMKGTKAAAQLTLKAIDLYDAVLGDIDFALGRWLAVLESAGNMDNTLIIVTGTNGQAFGQRSRFGVGHDVHQEQISVPLVIHLPDAFLGGQVLDEPVAVYDLYPTLADLFGLDGPEFQSSSSLAPLLVGDWLERPYPVTSRTVAKRPHYAMRQGHFKLIERTGRAEGATGTLHHLERDPLEQSDHSSKRPETLANMQADLRLFRAEAEKRGARVERAELPIELREELRALGYSGVRETESDL